MRRALLFVLLAGCGGASSEALAPLAADLDASPFSTTTEAGVATTHPRGAQQGRGDAGDPPAEAGALGRIDRDADAPEAGSEPPDAAAGHAGAVDAGLEAAPAPAPCTGDAGPSACTIVCPNTNLQVACCGAWQASPTGPNGRCGCTAIPDPTLCVYEGP